MNFSCRDFLIGKFEEKYRSLGFKGKTLEELKLWQEDMRGILWKKLGLDRFEKCPLNPVIKEDIIWNGFKRKKVVIETIENLFMPFYIIKPLNGGNGKPVIALHGHGSNGKEGLLGGGGRFNYTYAMYLAKRGYTVFIPDLCGSGERIEEVSQRRGSSSACTDINNAAISLGFTLQGIIVFELMRLADYMEEMKIPTDELRVIGFSGGGLSALWLSIFEKRIKVCYISGYFHGFKETILYNNLCGCNFVPDIWEMADMGDLGALVCPARLIVENGDEDPLNGRSLIANARPQMAVTAKAYDLYGSSEFYTFIGEGMHKFYGLGYEAFERSVGK